MQSPSDKKVSLETKLVEKDEQIVKLQSQINKHQLEIEVIKKSADEEKQRQENMHQIQLREQQRKYEEEIDDLKLQLQQLSTANTKTKTDHDAEVQDLLAKLTQEKDAHTQDETKIVTLTKEIEQLREEQRTLNASIAVVQNLSDKVCISYFYHIIVF